MCYKIKILRSISITFTYVKKNQKDDLYDDKPGNYPFPVFL